MKPEQKSWGTTTALLLMPMVEVHRIEVRPDMRCSMHRHERKWNAFVVLSGQLTIETEMAHGDTLWEVLAPGDFATVRPGVYHRFLTGPGTAVAIEVYYPDPVSLSEDIIRRDVGGWRWRDAAE